MSLGDVHANLPRVRFYDVKMLKPEQKSAIGADILLGHHSLNWWVLTLQTTKKTVRKWKEAAAGGYMILSGPGALPKLDDFSKEELQKKVRIFRRGNETLTNAKLMKLIQEAHDETAQAAGRNPSTLRLCETTLRNLRRDLDLGFGVAEPITDARNLAINDIRMFVSWATLLRTYVLDKYSRNLLFNFDPTHFTVKGGEGDQKHLIIKSERDTTNPAKYKDSGQLPMGVKVIFLGSAAGVVANPVFIMADPAMPKKGENSFKVYELIGGGLTADGDSLGYVAFAHTRQGCTELDKWYLESVMIPFIAKTRGRVPDGGNKRGCVFMDGEAQMIKAVMDPSMQTTFASSKIDAQKLPASLSLVAQPLDASFVFPNS